MMAAAGMPNATILSSSSWTMGQALEGMQAGKCAAVISVDLDVLFEMGPINDPHGKYVFPPPDAKELPPDNNIWRK